MSSPKKRRALGRGLGSLIPTSRPTPPPDPVPEPEAEPVDPEPHPAIPMPAAAAQAGSDAPDPTPARAPTVAPPLTPVAPESATTPTLAPPAPSQEGARFGPRHLAIEALQPDRGQPRKHFDRQRLEQLADSIRSQGIIQPIVVSPVPGQGGYVIVAGERRWRAAQIAGLHDVPVVLREADEEERLELALVENIQRTDLNPVEEAQAYKHLMDLRDYSQDELAERVGKDRSTISNTLRLLRLPDRVQILLQEGQLTTGHARALLGLATEDSMLALARDIVRDKLSVRATEAAVRKRLAGSPDPDEDVEDDETRRRRIIVTELQDRLRRKLGVKAQLKPGKGKRSSGRIELPYRDLDELDRLLKLILD